MELFNKDKDAKLIEGISLEDAGTRIKQINEFIEELNKLEQEYQKNYPNLKIDEIVKLTNGENRKMEVGIVDEYTEQPDTDELLKKIRNAFYYIFDPKRAPYL